MTLPTSTTCVYMKSTKLQCTRGVIQITEGHFSVSFKAVTETGYVNRVIR